MHSKEHAKSLLGEKELERREQQRDKELLSRDDTCGSESNWHSRWRGLPYKIRDKYPGSRKTTQRRIFNRGASKWALI